MHLKVINPNTSSAMTQVIAAGAYQVLPGDVQLSVVNPRMGPPSIESHYDEALCVPGILEEIEVGERQGVDGYVLACFGDPGLQAARELADGPVIGLAEAAMRTACYLGRSFSVVTTLHRTVGRALDLAAAYGVRDACAGVHAADVAVLDLDRGPNAFETVLGACRQALTADGSDVIVLGCAGMTSFTPRLSTALGVPVVDGVSAAVLTVSSLVRQGLRTSTRSEFAAPPPKQYVGELARFGSSEPIPSGDSAMLGASA